MNSPFLHRRIASAHQRMLSAKRWNWEMAWADAFCHYMQLIHKARAA